jgi:hypothetical protein
MNYQTLDSVKKADDWVMHPDHADIHVSPTGSVKITRGDTSAVLPADRKYVMTKGGTIRKISDLVTKVFPQLKE